ncbi:hypothetical protein Tco_1485411 [Tanacetum coccineum]
MQQVANALSHIFKEEEEATTSTFMALSHPIINLLDNLKSENETLEELCCHTPRQGLDGIRVRGRGGVEMMAAMVVAYREAAAGVGRVVKAAVMEAAVEVAAGCGNGGWHPICGWWDGGV